MSAVWSLCLVAEGNKRKVVKVNPESDTVEDLFRIAGEAYGASSVDSLKSGFPPAPLDANDSTVLSQAKNIGNQERVHVILGKTDAAKKKPAKKNGGRAKEETQTKTDTTSSPANAEGTRRTKRAAAQAATDSFADVIRQQDKMMNEEKQPPSKKTKRGGTSTKPKAPKFTSKEPGRRLGDGAVVGGISKKSKPKASPAANKKTATRKPKTTKRDALADQQKHEDMSTALLETLSQGGTGGRLLRKTMKSAVENSYESTKASARLAALESRTPLESVQFERIDDAKLRVRFQKVKGHGKGHDEDVVDWIPTEVLAEVLKAILKSNPDTLLPENLALLSPRFLWALAYRHWEEQKEKQKSQDAPSSWEPFSIGEAYRKLVPDHKDWSFLHHRKRNLSEKAKENLRQQEESESDEEGYEEAAEAVQDVEQAMENLQQFDRAQKADRIANAALARQLRQQQSSVGDDEWIILTPSEVDEDELLECIKAGETPLQNPKDATAIANLLIKMGVARNWRELANLVPTCLHAQVVDLERKFVYVTEQQVSEWVDYARLQSLEEIMVEICGGSVSYVQKLRDNAPVNTPKDLANWKAMPDLLLEELGGESVVGLTAAELSRFCGRASQALVQFEWLHWYVTSID